MAGAPIQSQTTVGMKDGREDTAIVTLTFSDGSIGVLTISQMVQSLWLKKDWKYFVEIGSATAHLGHRKHLTGQISNP